jgi:hypothetical protein
VWVAVRPEKVKIYTEQPAAGSIAFPAKVMHIAYHGSESHIFVHTQAGVELTATIQNANRQDTIPSLHTWVWVGWQPADTLVLRE